MKKIVIEIISFALFCGVVILFLNKCTNGQSILDKKHQSVYYCGVSCSDRSAVIEALLAEGLKKISSNVVSINGEEMLEEQYQKRFLTDSEIAPFFWSLYDFSSQDIYDVNVVITSDNNGRIRKLNVYEKNLAISKEKQKEVRKKLANQFEEFRELNDSLHTNIYMSGNVVLTYKDNMIIQIDIK